MSDSAAFEPEQLLREARTCEGPALGRLLEGYRGYLTLLARVQIGRSLQGKVDAADLVQEAFLQVQRNFVRFQGSTESEWIAWLRQILASRVAKLVRHYVGTGRRDVRLERQIVDELQRSSQALQEGLAAAHTSPSQRAVHREQLVLLAEALERLPADYRDVLILRHLEGLSLPEVARRLGRTLDSVKNLWARGLRQLRRALEDQP